MDHGFGGGSGAIVWLWKIDYHGNLVAAGKEPATHAILEYLVGQFLLVNFVKHALKKEAWHPRQGIDPRDFQAPGLIDDRPQQRCTHILAAKIRTHHQGPHFREVDHVNMQGDTAAQALLVYVNVKIPDILEKFREFTWKHAARLNRFVQKRFHGNDFRQFGFADDSVQRAEKPPWQDRRLNNGKWDT